MSAHHKKLNRRRVKLFRQQVMDAGKWRRAGILADGELCGKAGRLEADHITPMNKGGSPYDPRNGQPLCVSCHIAKTAKENSIENPARDKWREKVKTRLEKPTQQ